MKIKTKKGLVTIFAVALLLCLALAVGITGAFYQAKRQATGTLSMDQGIIIDYKGFAKLVMSGQNGKEQQHSHYSQQQTPNQVKKLQSMQQA